MPPLYDQPSFPPRPQAQRSSASVADIGELALIERLKCFCAPGAVGDDAAVIEIQPGHQMVVTTDMLVENVHFSGYTTPPYSVGWRAAAANLADIVAMGAQPLCLTVSLGLPASCPLVWLEDLYQGMADCLQRYGGAIYGGDLSRAGQRIISITAIGQVVPGQIIRRSAASPGMTVVVSGPHGASRAGLALLLEELELSPSLDSEAFAGYAQAWIQAHQMPVPKFDTLACLRQTIEQMRVEQMRVEQMRVEQMRVEQMRVEQMSIEQTRVEQMSAAGAAFVYPAIAGMDSSDGLANALLQISRASGVGMDIVRSQIPLPPGLTAAVGAQTALDWALYGGEDYELVLCLPKQIAQKLVQTPFATAIGTTTDTGIVQLVSEAGDTPAEPITHQGFRHF